MKHDKLSSHAALIARTTLFVLTAISFACSDPGEGAGAAVGAAGRYLLAESVSFIEEEPARGAVRLTMFEADGTPSWAQDLVLGGIVDHRVGSRVALDDGSGRFPTPFHAFLDTGLALVSAVSYPEAARSWPSHVDEAPGGGTLVTFDSFEEGQRLDGLALPHPGGSLALVDDAGRVTQLYHAGLEGVGPPPVVVAPGSYLLARTVEANPPGPVPGSLFVGGGRADVLTEVVTCPSAAR